MQIARTGPEDLIAAADAARILGLSADMVRLLARSGRLPTAIQSARGARLFRREDVAWLAAERAGDPTGDHAVKFYEDEAALARTVTEFIGDALRAGAPVVVIATRPHRAAFRARLESDGYSVVEAVRSRRVMLLDAEGTLKRFMVAGMPDRARFEATIGAALDALRPARRGLAVRAYGEMVNVLWASGQAAAALRLEQLWTRLLRRRSFSLLCHYALAHFRRTADRAGFEQICREHTRISPPDGFPAAGCGDDAFRQVALLQQRALAGEDAQRRAGDLEEASRRQQRKLAAATRGLRSAVDAINRALAMTMPGQRAPRLERGLSRLVRLAEELDPLAHPAISHR